MLKQLINENLKLQHIAFDVDMSNYCTLKLGGKAECLVDAVSVEEIIDVINFCNKHNVNLTVIGNGSNIIVLSKGISGVCLRVGKFMANIKLLENNCIYAQAGATLRAISNFAEQNSLEGMSFASGIPGTAGGGAIMNAGAYGLEMKDVIESVDVVIEDGNLKTLSNEELGFSYRNSALQNSGSIVVGITYKLALGDKQQIKANTTDLNKRRADKQPLDLPSCGSTFKRPEGNYASALIDQCGLKGYRVGGCSVSTKHSGFLVNDNKGTADEFVQLIDEVKEIVYNKTGYVLETEVKILGR